jgi:hypothetical protein
LACLMHTIRPSTRSETGRDVQVISVAPTSASAYPIAFSALRANQ